MTRRATTLGAACLTVLLATAWAPAVLAQAGGDTASPTLDPAAVDARAAALGGVSGIDGDLLEPLFSAPAMFGTTNHSRFAFQRAWDRDGDTQLFTRDRFGLVSAGRGFDIGFGFGEDRRPAGAQGASRLDRRLALGMGAPLVPSGRIGLGATASVAALGSGADAVFGYTAGLGLPFYPQLREDRRWLVAPSVRTLLGRRFEDLPSSERLAWGVVSSYARDDLGLLGVVDVRDAGPGGTTWHAGLEGDLGRLLTGTSRVGPINHVHARLGLNQEGATFGAGVTAAGLCFDIASGRDAEGAFAAWSVAHRWGPGQVELRRRESALDDEIDMAIAQAEDHRRRGEYDAAAALLEAIMERSSRMELRDLAAEIRDLQEKLALADAHYMSVENDEQGGRTRDFMEVYEEYKTLVEASPEFARAELRREVARDIGSAQKKYANALKDDATELLYACYERDPSPPIIKSLLLEEADLIDIRIRPEPIFMAAYQRYWTRPAGHVLIRNRLPFAVEGLEVTAKLTYLECDANRTDGVAIAPRDSVRIPLLWRLPALTASDFDVADVQVKVSVEFTRNPGTDTVTANQQVQVYKAGFIDWQQPLQIGSFVTIDAKDIRRLGMLLPEQPPAEYADAFASGTRALHASAMVYALFEALDIRYQNDPRPSIRPASGAGQRTVAIDKVKYPAETLAKPRLTERTGDCDDFVVLWASLLGAQGVNSVPVIMSGHIMLLVDLETPATRWQRLNLPQDLLVFRDGRVWLPVETTSLNGGFVHACRSGKINYDLAEDGERIHIAMDEAWEEYPRSDFSLNSDLSFQREPFDRRVAASLAELQALLSPEPAPGPEPEEASAGAADVGPALAAGAMADDDCATLAALAFDLCTRGDWQAADALLAATGESCVTAQAAIFNNRGCVALQQKNYGDAVRLLSRAHQADPADGGIVLNLRLAEFMAAAGENAAAADSALTRLRNTIIELGLDTSVESLGGLVPAKSELAVKSGVGGDDLVYSGVQDVLDVSGGSAAGVARKLEAAATAAGEFPVYYKDGENRIAPPQAPEPVTGRRTETRFPEQVRQGETAMLEVAIVPRYATGPDGRSTALPGHGEHEVDLEGLAAGSVVDVTVRPYNFTAQHTAPLALTVPAEGASATLQVPLTADRVGQGLLVISFSHEGGPLATVLVESRIVPRDSEAVTATRTVVNHLTRGAEAPDLVLVVHGQGRGDDAAFTFLLGAPASAADGVGLRECGTLPCQADPAQWMMQQVTEIEKQRRAVNKDETTPQVVANRMQAFGREIAAWLPAEVRAALAALDEGAAVLVLTEDPVIPWEMAYLAGAENGDAEGGFLCEKFSITRWLLNGDIPARIPLHRGAVITAHRQPGLPPVYSQGPALLSDLERIGVTVEPQQPTTSQLLELFERGGRNLYHFDLHGDFQPMGDLSTLYFKGGSLAPLDLQGPNFRSIRHDQPLVFLNACTTGRTDYAPAGASGWPLAFLDAGASAVVAPLWDVNDSAAGIFAKAVYHELAYGATIGQAVQRARLKLRDSDRAFSWLGYVVYAHPNATLSVPGYALR